MPVVPDEEPRGVAARHVAGVRLPSGRQVFVEHVPGDLRTGTSIRLRLDGQEIDGMVSIPPPLIVWRDPGARCAAFVGVIAMPTVTHTDPGARPEALYLSEQEAPDETTLAAMLDLARHELHRLDD